ncbi:MAG TPA: hypothetical protein VKQ52_13560, partial [Puia sp.]|nr:hypothetical protein [Puia sp.]
FYTASVLDAAGLNDYSVAQFGTEVGWVPLMIDTATLYDQNSLTAASQKATSYTYSAIHYQPITATTTNSNGDTAVEYMSYPLDYIGLTGSDKFTQGILSLQNANIVTPAIEKYAQMKTSNGTFIGTMGSMLTSYNSQSLLPDTIWSTQYSKPSASFNPLSANNGTLTKDAAYIPQVVNSKYDLFGNVIEQQKINDLKHAYVWDYLGTYPIASVGNADSANIAYTSFEADGSGNWSIGSGAVDTTRGFTGRRCYQLSGSISKSGLTPSLTYLVSYWTLNNSALTIPGTISGYPVKGKTIAINGANWTLYVHKVTGQSTVTVSGNGVAIDELRLYPSTAQMTTYTYDPLIGMTSQTDAGNRATYYEYDGLGRLKRVRDQDYNIVKTLEYQYQATTGCGSGCSVVPMQTLAGTKTIGYPVGVFNVNGKLLGNAAGPDDYVTKWNSDAADNGVGTLTKGRDSLYFNLTLNSGQTVPAGVTGCRYYQYDLPWNVLDGVTANNADYVDFGDGTGMRLPATVTDTPAVMPANTTRAGFFDQFTQQWWFIHSYADSSLKTLTFYHSDDTKTAALDNAYDPAVSLTKVRNLRGNLPQGTTQLGGSCYQQASALTVANITNWNSIGSVTGFWPHCGDATTPCMNMSYAQDFMKNNRGLNTINTTQVNVYEAGYRDMSFKLSRLKSDWNTYFTQLQDLEISDDHWDHEDLSALTHLKVFLLMATDQGHSNVHLNANDYTSNPPVTIPASVADGILNQIAAGAGQNVTNGFITILGNYGGRTSASNAAVQFLQSRGWTINVQ